MKQEPQREKTKPILQGSMFKSKGEKYRGETTVMYC